MVKVEDVTAYQEEKQHEANVGGKSEERDRVGGEDGVRKMRDTAK